MIYDRNAGGLTVEIKATESRYIQLFYVVYMYF